MAVHGEGRCASPNSRRSRRKGDTCRRRPSGCARVENAGKVDRLSPPGGRCLSVSGTPMIPWQRSRRRVARRGTAQQGPSGRCDASVDLVCLSRIKCPQLDEGAIGRGEFRLYITPARRHRLPVATAAACDDRERWLLRWSTRSVRGRRTGGCRPAFRTMREV